MAGLAKAVGGKFADALSGNIKDAYLIIHDYRTLGKQLEQQVAAGQSPKSLAEKRKISTQQVMAGMREMDPGFRQSEEKVFHIHFNPSQLLLNSSSFPVEKKSVSGSTTITDTVENPSLTLSVPLIFDEVKVWDAFLWDRIHSVKNMALATADAALHKTHTVRPEVEALIAALRNPYTRCVSFHWADFVFTGQLTNIQGGYTMFSPSGEPVRAQLTLRIKHEMDEAMLYDWYQNFALVFEKPGIDLTPGAQKRNALLGR